MDKKKNIPQLRFPEFHGEWGKKQIIDVAPLQRGFDLPQDNIREGKYPVVFSNGILAYHNEYKVKGPGVVTGRSGTIGKVTYVEENFWAHNTSLWVTDFKGNDPKYIFYFYSRFNLEKLATGSGVPTLNRNDIHAKYIYFPSYHEQQKIASFFTTIDQKISQLKRKKTLLEQYKKGLMQKIFTQQIRFKDDNGQEFPKWEKKKLGDCLDYIQPTKYIVNTTEYDNSYQIPVLTAGKSFILGYTDETEGIYNDCLPVIIFDDFTTSSQFVDFAFKVKSSAMKILVAKLNVNIKYIFEAMQTLNYEIGGHERHWISKFSPMCIDLPSLPEQTKIASFLSTIDDKITHTQKQIEKAEVWKKGLMQQMFV
jgi:type I restriction enzyme S subunit